MSDNVVTASPYSSASERGVATQANDMNNSRLPTDGSLLSAARLDRRLAALPAGPINAQMVNAVIRKYSNGTPVIRGQDLIDAADRYKVDIRLMLAMGVWESHFGTDGDRPRRTRNVFNVGNNDHGGNRTFSSYREGIFEYAKLISSRFSSTLEGFVASKGASKADPTSFYCERFPGARDGAAAAAAYSREILRTGRQLSQYLYQSGKL
jgi:hypothetical protein